MSNENAPDFNAEQVLRVEDAQARAWKSLLSPILLMVIVIFLLAWFILTVLFNMLALPAAGVIGFVVALVVTAIVIWIRVLLVQRTFRDSWIALSPTGIEMRAGSVTRRIAWGDLTGAGIVKPMRGVETSAGGSSARTGQAIGAGINRTVQALSGTLGLFGRGTLVGDPSRAVAGNLLQTNAGTWGTDPATGEPLVGIAPAELLGTDWFSGPTGAWLRRFRPDIAQAVEQQASKKPGQEPGETTAPPAA